MITVYTCITDQYDQLLKQPSFKDVNYVCFCDVDREIKKDGWNLKPLISPPSLTDSSLINRYHKLLCYNFNNTSKFSIYIDGNVLLQENPNNFTSQFEENNLIIGAFRHELRKDVSSEIDACLASNMFNDAEIKELQRFYNETILDGFNNDNGLSANYILVRRQQNTLLNKAMQDWWLIVKNRVKRDQLSLQFVLWKNLIPWIELNGFIIPKKFFSRFPHGQYSLFLPLKIQSFIKKVIIKLSLIKSKKVN